jgi:hypothetical protein
VVTLRTLIRTRRDLVPVFYARVAPTLVVRIREREANVLVEVLATLVTLLEQTTGAGRVPPPEAGSGGRKSAPTPTDRCDAHAVDRISLMLALTNVGCASVRRQVSGRWRHHWCGRWHGGSRTARCVPDARKCFARAVCLTMRAMCLCVCLCGRQPRTRQTCFTLLKELVQAQAGVLTGLLSLLVPGTVAVVSDKTHTATLRVEALAFVRHLFRSHPAAALHKSLGALLPPVLAATADRYPKTAVEALQACLELARSVHTAEGMCHTEPLTAGAGRLGGGRQDPPAGPARARGGDS